VDCRHAQRLMNEALDGEPMPSALAEHIAGCPACRAESRALEATQRLVAEALDCPAPAAALDRLTAVTLAAAAARPVRPRRLMPALGGLAVAAIFCLGLLAGRWAFPREVVTERIVQAPAQERVVRVEVPVVQERIVVRERVVTREVPVVRTRVVYRDRPGGMFVSLPPRKAEPLPMVHIQLPPMTAVFPETRVTSVSRPARAVGEPEAPATLETPREPGTLGDTGSSIVIASSPEAGGPSLW
jgi:hypothetical protein